MYKRLLVLTCLIVGLSFIPCFALASFTFAKDGTAVAVIATDCPNARVMYLAYWISRSIPQGLKLESNVHVTVTQLRDFTETASAN